MIQEAINELIQKHDISFEVAQTVMDEIMSGEATPAQISAFLTSLHMKGETIDEITACAAVMRKHCTEFKHEETEVIDIVGTGGDCAGTFNISTLASLVVSAAGIKVAKHGNRAASSQCGTADVLEQLGVNLSADVKVSETALHNLGICFLFAQKYHTAMRFVGGVRREIRIPTVFNILGPLANPAKANLQLLGVYDEKLVEPLAHVLSKLGVKRGMVVHGMDGLDEISLSDRTLVCEFDEGEFLTYILDPRDYGFSFCKKEDLVGGSKEVNANIAEAILNGEKGPKRNAVVLNAAAAIHIAKKISLSEAILIAEEILDQKLALSQLKRFVQVTNVSELG